jgi:hypothetical protein
MPPLVAHVQLCKAKGEAGDKLRTRSWVLVQLIGEDDSPIPNEAYAIELPGGKKLEGTLDDQGSVRFDGLPPGRCRVAFPDLDKEAWADVETQPGQPAS